MGLAKLESSPQSCPLFIAAYGVFVLMQVLSHSALFAKPVDRSLHVGFGTLKPLLHEVVSAVFVSERPAPLNRSIGPCRRAENAVSVPQI